ncbi:MAG TPA: hypothetical protein VND67_08615 [Acidimicrobiales bacterium]|nr:hypothetical protein [Acidimicrobiales bacterium]
MAAEPTDLDSGSTDVGRQPTGSDSGNDTGTGPASHGPAYYASGDHTWWRDVRAVLHPPYTAWHLSYVVIGSLIGPRVNWATLGATVLAFFLAVGVAAHCLDELRGRPLGTLLPARFLVAAAAITLVGAVAIGIVGVYRLGPWLAAFIVVGAFLVLAYNLELFGGLVHNGIGFALGWGAFPVLTAAFAQDRSLPISAIILAVAATLLSAAQRLLSTPARTIRRHAVSIEGRMVLDDGRVQVLDHSTLLAPIEKTLRALSWTTVVLAVSLVVARLSH